MILDSYFIWEVIDVGFFVIYIVDIVVDRLSKEYYRGWFLLFLFYYIVYLIFKIFRNKLVFMYVLFEIYILLLLLF